MAKPEPQDHLSASGHCAALLRSIPPPLGSVLNSYRTELCCGSPPSNLEVSVMSKALGCDQTTRVYGVGAPRFVRQLQGRVRPQPSSGKVHPEQMYHN